TENIDCQDYIIVRLNRTTNRIDAQIEKNPVVCSFLEDFQIFSSLSNRLLVTFIFSELRQSESEISQPQIEFFYYTEPLCDNYFTRISKDLISYSSLESVHSNDLTENINCYNTIKLKHTRRIVLHNINWLTTHNQLNTGLSYWNGQTMCENADSLIINNQNPKYNESSSSQYCMDNPLNSFLSDSNILHLNFKRSIKPTHLIKPLIFDIGYFSYKYLYTEVDSVMSVDFARIIPDNVANTTRIDVLPIKIQLKNNDRYIYPVISDCFTDVKSGLIMIRTSQKSIPFKLLCHGQTYTVLSSTMDNEILIEFINVDLDDLRQVKFTLNYTLPNRIMTEQKGTFGTNDFKHLYLNTKRESVEYFFEIKLDENQMVRLSVDELKNDFAINEFNIIDANKEQKKKILIFTIRNNLFKMQNFETII
ncbi:hypothetical protein BpHYR1_003252, partial [Brachionus plicatilis]